MLDQATLLSNFASNVVNGQAFANMKRINELFCFGRRRRIRGDDGIKQVITWVNKILSRYCLKVVRRGDRVRLARKHGILDVVRRWTAKGSYLEDSVGLLNQRPRPLSSEPDLGQALDAFIDDD